MRSEKDESEQFQQNHEPLDFSPASGPPGSEQKNLDKNLPDTHDSRSKTVTTFNPDYTETPFPRKIGMDDDDERFNSSKQRWQWLRKLNDGLREEDRSIRNDEVRRERDVEWIASQFELTEYQTERTKYLLETAKEDRDGGLFFGKNKPIEITIVAAITLTANADGYWVQRDESVPYDTVTADYIPDEVEEPTTEIHSMRKILKEYL